MLITHFHTMEKMLIIQTSFEFAKCFFEKFSNKKFVYRNKMLIIPISWNGNRMINLFWQNTIEKWANLIYLNQKTNEAHPNLPKKNSSQKFL